MDFDEGINVVYRDGQERSSADAANEYLKDIPISVRGSGALELEMATIDDKGVSLSPRKGTVWYDGIENIDSQKYSVKLTSSTPELGGRPMLFVAEKSEKQRWVRMFNQPKEDSGN